MKTNKLLSVLSILVMISLNAYGQDAKTQSNQDKVTTASSQPDSVQAVMCHIGIGDYVWLDTDADGYQDWGENGINDVQLKLYWRKHTYDSWQLYDTQTTRYGNGKKGYYFFSYTDSEADALIPGYFKVDVVESTLPPGLTLTTNNEPFVKYFNYWEYYYKADFGYTPGKPSLEILTEFEVSCAKMVYNTTGWVKNTGDAGGDVAEDVHFWYVVKDPANEKYIDNITFSGDFTNLVGQEQREVGLTITMTDEWKNTAYNTAIGVWIYAEPTNRPGHVAKETLTITSHWGQKIIIEKQTTPDGSTKEFDFNGSIDTNLKDNQTSSKQVGVGTYKVNEVVPAGWTLTNITVNDGNSTVDIPNGEVTFNVEANETVKAVFYNRQDATIIIEKQTDPDGSPQSFDFDGEIDVNLTDGQSQSKTVVPGTYSVNENVPAGWTLTDIVITDPTGNSTKNVGAGSVSFDVSA
ncbi:MAG: SdrD B-like domain-containing protein, partial [bacterium]